MVVFTFQLSPKDDNVSGKINTHTCIVTNTHMVQTAWEAITFAGVENDSAKKELYIYWHEKTWSRRSITIGRVRRRIFFFLLKNFTWIPMTMHHLADGYQHNRKKYCAFGQVQSSEQHLIFRLSFTTSSFCNIYLVPCIDDISDLCQNQIKKFNKTVLYIFDQ